MADHASLQRHHQHLPQPQDAVQSLSNPNDDKTIQEATTLTFPFRSKSVPVYISSHISVDLAQRALESETFQHWVHRCETSRNSSMETTASTSGSSGSAIKCLDLHSVELQSIDLFGPRRVGFIKLKSHATLTTTTTAATDSNERKISNSDVQSEFTSNMATTSPQPPHPLPGICFLRGNAVSMLVVLQCLETDERYILMVEQPRVPVGLVSSLELPAGMIDSSSDGIKGTAIRELEEECGIHIVASELTDLTQYVVATPNSSSNTSFLANTADGLAPSPGGCDEHIRLLYLHRYVTQEELTTMQGRLTGLRDEGELITLHVVPYEEAWKISGDMKVMCSMFLLEQLQKEGKLPIPMKPLAQQQTTAVAPAPAPEPTLTMNNGLTIPQMAFGLYLVPADDEGEKIISHAIEAGYRHFDTASYYKNEATLGRAIAKSGIPRKEFFLCSKVWNDAQNEGRQAVRESVLSSLQALCHGCGDGDPNPYWDLYLIHWPVPDKFVDTYKELEELQQEGSLKSIGISNFTIAEYEALVQSGITVPPAVLQMEVSPVMYRAQTIDYFQRTANVVVSASKALSRGSAFDAAPIQQLAKAHFVSPAQILLRWSIQKGLVVVTKTANRERMRDNRDLWGFSLSSEEMNMLNSMTTQEAVYEHDAVELERKRSM